MQPYFYPYIGYFQLIHAVDTYVNLDHVAFMKRSYMTRNVLQNNVVFNVQVNKGTQNQTCNKTTVNFEHGHIQSTLKTIRFLYSKSERYEEIMESLVVPVFYERYATISSFNLEIIKRVCQYLNIKTNILDTSEGLSAGLRGEKELIHISNTLDGKTYINAPGGQKLYSKSNFLNEGLELKFITMKDVDLKNPYLSILHQAFQYPKEHLIKQVTNYVLI